MTFLRHALFALLLVLSQTGVFTHAIGHVGESRQDSGLPDHHLCELCLSHTHFGAALPATGLPALPPRPTIWAAAEAWTAFTPPCSTPYQSRAPPVLA